MIQKGLTLPNVAFRPYSTAELTALDDLRPSVLIWLLYGGAIDQTHAQQIAPYILAHQPRIIYRPYAGNIPDWDPPDWAFECDRRIRAVGLGECLPGNEFNLTSEGGSTNWGDHIYWLTLFSRTWRKLNDRILHLPALSPSGNYKEGLLAYHDAGLAKLFDVIDFHCYTEQHVRDADSAALVFGALDHPIEITEFNRITLDQIAMHITLPTQCLGAMWFLLGGTPDQQAFDILKQPDAYQSFKAWRPTLTEYDSPNHGGVRPSTVGVVLHATLSTKNNTVQQEYDATCNYFRDPASQVSAHAVVGPSGQVHYPVRLDLEAWHCLQANDTHVGIEMAKSHLADPLRDDILEETAQVVAGWCKTYNIPLQWSITHGIAEHREMPGNNHQDVGGPFDRADFLNRVKHYAKEDELTDAQKKAVLDDLDFLWAYSKADQIVKNPAESERILHERIVALKVTLGLNG